ncbi:MAG: MerR family DNA-binding transcriptional regulator [Pseudomonadota bacterium]
MADTRLSFKEMCEKFDVTPRTLRYYEYIELLSPERQGRSRFYGPTEIARMTLILRGRRWGFSLEELRQWLLIYDEEGSDKQMATFVEYAERQLIELRKKQVELDQVIGELEGLKDSLKKELGAA